MGMDSYFYRTTKKENEDYVKILKRSEEARKATYDIVKNLVEKYPNLKKRPTRENFVKTATKEEVAEYDAAYQNTLDADSEMKKAYEEQAEQTELFYWRKAWGLHWYIVEHCGDHEDDNTVRVYVTKDFIAKLVNELGRYTKMSIDEYNAKPIVNEADCYKNNPFGKDEFWDMDDVIAAYDFFKDILDNWDDDMVYYYYSWY